MVDAGPCARLVSIGAVFALLTSTLALAGSLPEPRFSRLALEENWRIESGSMVKQDGREVSTVGFPTGSWYPTKVPSTVLASLVEEKVYGDPYFGLNLRYLPGASYPVGGNFANISMPPESPFRVPWWYRTEFTLPDEPKGRRIWLHLDGINYRANVWLNGQKVAGADVVVGMYRLFEFDVTPFVKPGQPNALAIETVPPFKDDLSTAWVDWSPHPPDKNLGLWRDVYLTASGPVALRFPHVVTELDKKGADVASVKVSVEVVNATDQSVTGELSGSVEAIRLRQSVTLAPRERRVVRFDPQNCPELRIEKPRLWWPVYTGPQNLYPLELSFTVGGDVSDRSQIRFGIREITSELTKGGHLLFKVNGKNILIRGGGWAPDMMLRSSAEREESEIRYVRDLGLNTIRLEGKLETDRFHELCDRYGILVMAGWCCCSHWELWKNWKGQDLSIATESLRDQLRRIRHHPSTLTWLYGSDEAPPPDVEKAYLDVVKAVEWPNPTQAAAGAKVTPLGGSTGMKMNGPYDYVEPSYWYIDQKNGGAFGFNSETSPGAAPPPLESLKKMFPSEQLWPINEAWHFHGGGTGFKDSQVFTVALENRFGRATGVEDYARKAQIQAYEGHRAMFEAFGRNKYESTGVVQWMLNNPWPSTIWHLYDYFLRPGGSYFGAKKANEPLHVQYSYDDRSVAVVNNFYTPCSKLKVTARVFDLTMKEKFQKESTIDVQADSTLRAFTIPTIADLTPVYFIHLTLADSAGVVKSTNFYWLSTKAETSDFEKTDWRYTPVASYGDYTALASLPRVRLEVESGMVEDGAESKTTVSLKNPSPHLAFFVHLRVAKGAAGEEILPILWEDNYLSLLPGETRKITATYAKKLMGSEKPYVTVDGWNIDPVDRPASASR